MERRCRSKFGRKSPGTWPSLSARPASPRAWRPCWSATTPAARSTCATSRRRAKRPASLSQLHRPPTETTTEELLALIDRLNRDPAVHGILVQSPPPKHIDEKRVLEAVDPMKDVDCFSSRKRRPTHARPAAISPLHAARRSATAAAQWHSDRRGQRRDRRTAATSSASRWPILLMQKGPGGDATVTVCHSRTRDLPAP